LETDVILAIIARQPEVGRTKTYLVPPLTHQQAADLAAALLRDTLALAARLDGLALAVAFTPADARPYFEALASPGTRLLPVSGRDMGARLSAAMWSLFAQGYRRVLTIRADGPSLPPAYIQRAAARLEDHDVVFGRGYDGGYYMVGMRAAYTRVFDGIAWGTASVLDQSLAQAHAEGLRAAIGSPWYGVATPRDLHRLQVELRSLPPDQLLHTRAFLEAADFHLDFNQLNEE